MEESNSYFYKYFLVKEMHDNCDTYDSFFGAIDLAIHARSLSNIIAMNEILKIESSCEFLVKKYNILKMAQE